MSSLFCSTEREVLVTQSCPVLCDPMGCSPPGSSVHGILQARILECVAICFLLFRQLHNSIFLKLFIFLSKELFQVPFTVFQGIEIFFHLENIVKIKISGHPKLQCLVNTVNESELPSQVVTVCTWSSKKHAVLLYSDRKLQELIVWLSRRSS